MTTRDRRRIYHLLSDLLDYPRGDLAGPARECALLLAPELPEAAGHMKRFLGLAAETAPGRMEEIYTGTFDMNPTCTIYAGYQLFGESYKRGEFLVRLKGKYREEGFSEGSELADHLSVLLRFLSGLDPEEDTARELIEDCLAPAVRKMNGSFPAASEENVNPYACVLRVVAGVIEQDLPANAA